MTDDPTVCNECVCAFCEDKAQVIDLCPLHAGAAALNKQLVEALEEQWGLNHTEYCGWDLPCRRAADEGTRCRMPMPAALAKEMEE